MALLPNKKTPVDSHRHRLHGIEIAKTGDYQYAMESLKI